MLTDDLEWAVVRQLSNTQGGWSRLEQPSFVYGKIETFFQFFGSKEALEQNLINHAEKHELTLTKDLVNGTYFVDKNQLYIQRVKK